MGYDVEIDHFLYVNPLLGDYDELPKAPNISLFIHLINEMLVAKIQYNLYKFYYYAI